MDVAPSIFIIFFNPAQKKIVFKIYFYGLHGYSIEFDVADIFWIRKFKKMGELLYIISF